MPTLIKSAIHIFILYLYLYSFILPSQYVSAQDFQFDRNYVGVALTPYVKNWEATGVPGKDSYTIYDLQVMLELIHTRFSKLATYGIGAEQPEGLPLAEARIPKAAAELNRNKGTNVTIIQGLHSQHLVPILQELEISNTVKAVREANSIFPGTVTGIVFQENLAVLRNLLEKRTESHWVNVSLGARIQNCSVATDSLRQHAMDLDFIMCTIFPPDATYLANTALAFEAVVQQFNQSAQLLKSVNPNLQVYLGETGWPSSGKDTTKFNVLNLKTYWEAIGRWANQTNVTVYMFEAVDQPWKSNPNIQDPENSMGRFGIGGNFGWWKRTDAYNNNLNSFLEKISDLPKFEDTEVSADNTAVYTSIPIISIVIISGLIACLYRQKRARDALLQLKLTDDDIIEFENGATGPTAINEPWNLPYQKEYEIPKDELRIDRHVILGSGAFGIVYSGSVQTGQKQVAIKTIKAGATAKELKNLLSEIKIMIFIGKNENIVGLIGAQTSDLKSGCVYLAAEFCSCGSLEKYLRNHPFIDSGSEYANLVRIEDGNSYANSVQQVNVSVGVGNGNDVRYVNGPTHKPDKVQTTISMSNLLNWSYEIASGMEYLVSRNVIHADLAARNILLTNQIQAKITDFGLSRRLYEYTQYVKKNQEPLPWRWMAIESLRNMTFSSQSDVWSYGITLWEIFSMGGIPYPGLSWDVTFLQELDNGLRMNQPRLASNDTYTQMIQTWHAISSERPSFTTLKNYFNQERLNMRHAIC